MKKENNDVKGIDEAQLEMNMSTAFNIFARTVVRQHGIPLQKTLFQFFGTFKRGGGGCIKYSLLQIQKRFESRHQARLQIIEKRH